MINFRRIRSRDLSLKVKITLIAVLISLVSFGFAAFLSTRWMAEEIEEDYRFKAELMQMHIIHDLEESMLRRTHGDLFTTLDIYRAYKEVEEVRVFNSKGKEVFTKEKGAPEIMVEEVLTTQKPLYSRKKMEDRDIALSIIPIRNKSECHSCHEKDEPLRGALLLSLNMKWMEDYIMQQRKKFLILFSLLGMVILGSTGYAVKRLFLNPLRAIKEGAEAIEKGDFKHQIPVKSYDEVGTLTRNFNHMAQTLQSFFSELNDKNKQLTEQFLMITRSQKEWQETFDCITDPIAVIDSQCVLIRANKAFKETFEEFISPPQDKMVDRKCNELFGICLLSNCPHRISMEKKEPTTREIYGQKTGKVFEISMFPYYSQHGDFTGSITILKDITEKKENEIRLIMNERLAALGEMASGIAHELNNPLATIAVCTESLLKRVRTPEADFSFFENYLNIIEEEIHRCKHITFSLLSFVRGPSREKQEINLHEVLNKTIELIGFQGRLTNVKVLKNYPEEKLIILGSEGELRQVFQSMILNALEAMEDKGLLTLETGISNNTVFIKIGDTGHGMSPETIGRIFNPFFTTKSEKGGTGLGLSIARKIVEENKGKIEVTSEEGKGTTFTITLPL
jgi:nitrogen fixation/metabolism regulation signal transduction histidine kinase